MSRVVPELRALGRIWSAAWAEAWSNQRSFWTQIAFMVLNNLVFVAFWAFFFARIESIDGWTLARVMMLLAILATSAGAVLGLLHNVRRIGHMAADGHLDATLTLPTRPLAHLLVRRIEPVNLGDLVFGVVLFAIFAPAGLGAVIGFVYGVTVSVLVLTGFLVLIGSLSFWAGRNDAGDLGFHSVILFANYPIDLFSGMVRLLLYVVVPAGFVTAVPVRLVHGGGLGLTVGAGVVAVAFFAAGALAFSAGLRRYASGSSWTSA